MKHINKTLSFLISILFCLTACDFSQKGPSIGGFSWFYEYNEQGDISKITAPGNKLTELNYTYFNKPGQPIQSLTKKTEDATVTFLYDEQGRITQMTDEAGTVNYTYDVLGNVASVVRDNADGIYYTYNTNGMPTSVTLSTGEKTEYVYDFLGRLSTMKTPAGDINYTYLTAENMVQRVLPNGIYTQYKYNAAGQLESIAHIDKDSKVIKEYKYAYTPDGLINKVHEWTRQGEKNYTYTYDKGQRLASFTDYKGTKTEYKYDNQGNRTQLLVNGKESENYKNDWLGRIQNYNGNKCVYDNAGNLKSLSNDGTSYEYYSNNKLKTANNVQYKYDGSGGLISRTLGNKQTSYVNNPLSPVWQPLLSMSGTHKTYYIWEGNTPVAAIENGNISYFLTDHLGSARNIVNSNGNITQSIDYSPFGIPSQTITQSDFTPAFAGRFYDNISNLYLQNGNAYNPNIGKDIQSSSYFKTNINSRVLNSNLSNNTYSPDISDLSGETFIKNLLTETQIVKSNFFMNQLNEEINYNYPAKYAAENYVQTMMLSLLPYSDILSTPLSCLEVARNALKYAGSSMQIMNPPLFLDTKTNTGWSGNYYLHNKDLSLQINDKLYTNAPKWHDKGNITQNRDIFLENDFGTFSYKETNITPASSYVERFMMHTYPVEKYYDPLTSQYSSITQRELSYTTITKNGKTKIIPSTSNVGGVYLSGASKYFEGFGQISGIAVDEATGKLILISDSKKDIELPALRLDDIVTIFRCVYESGKAPFVSIDPDPKNSKGKQMLTRHSTSTKNTYVGWVLFEADRIMKTYSMGVDNISKKNVTSKVVNYDRVLNDMFEGEYDGEIWERFCIVPVSVNKNISAEEKTTLFELPLMVKTEKMIMRNGKLEKAPNGKSTKGAESFSNWFTTSYAQIADEVKSLPPAGSGFCKPVPVFKELQRMALITAIAEQLRDQGVALPEWMRHYNVKPCITPLTTEAHTVKKEKGNFTYSVYGGVVLMPRDVKMVQNKNAPLADEVSRKVSSNVLNPLNNPHQGIRFSNLKLQLKNGNNETRRILVLPGNNTQDVLAQNIMENDLVIALPDKVSYFSFSRKYNSFNKPVDNMFGDCWSLDLPVLVKHEVPIQTDQKGTKLHEEYTLTTELNSFSQKIDNTYKSQNKTIGLNTIFINNFDGKKIYFNKETLLCVAIEDNGKIVLFVRDGNNRIMQLAYFYGNYCVADIKLYYDIKNRLSKILASNKEEVNYIYAKDGTLQKVKNSEGEVNYTYSNGMLTGIKNKNEDLKFAYNTRGQLDYTIINDNTKISRKLETKKDGYYLTVIQEQSEAASDKSFFSFMKPPKKSKKPAPQQIKEMYHLDKDFKTLKAEYEDGTEISCDYSHSDYNIENIVSPDGRVIINKLTKDGKIISSQYPDGTVTEEKYDDNGRSISSCINNVPVLNETWHDDGRISSISSCIQKLNYEYNQSGTTKSVLITPPGDAQKWNEWVEVMYDDIGRIAQISDYAGSVTQYIYNQKGELSDISSKLGKTLITHDNKSQVKTVETSWGHKYLYSYNKKGELTEIAYIVGNDTSYVRFENRTLSEIKLYNGAKYTFAYSDNKKLNKISTPSNTFVYEYNTNGQIKSAVVKKEYKIYYLYDEQNRIKEVKYMADKSIF